MPYGKSNKEIQDKRAGFKMKGFSAFTQKETEDENVQPQQSEQGKKREAIAKAAKAAEHHKNVPKPKQSEQKISQGKSEFQRDKEALANKIKTWNKQLLKLNPTSVAYDVLKPKIAAARKRLNTYFGKYED